MGPPEPGSPVSPCILYGGGRCERYNEEITSANHMTLTIVQGKISPFASMSINHTLCICRSTMCITFM